MLPAIFIKFFDQLIFGLQDNLLQLAGSDSRKQLVFVILRFLGAIKQNTVIRDKPKLSHFCGPFAVAIFYFPIRMKQSNFRIFYPRRFRRRWVYLLQRSYGLAFFYAFQNRIV